MFIGFPISISHCKLIKVRQKGCYHRVRRSLHNPAGTIPIRFHLLIHLCLSFFLRLCCFYVQRCIYTNIVCVEGEREIPYVREKKRRGVCEVRTDCGEKERETVKNQGWWWRWRRRLVELEFCFNGKMKKKRKAAVEKISVEHDVLVVFLFDNSWKPIPPGLFPLFFRSKETTVIITIIIN